MDLNNRFISAELSHHIENVGGDGTKWKVKDGSLNMREEWDLRVSQTLLSIADPPRTDSVLRVTDYSVLFVLPTDGRAPTLP